MWVRAWPGPAQGVVGKGKGARAGGEVIIFRARKSLGEREREGGAVQRQHFPAKKGIMRDGHSNFFINLPSFSLQILIPHLPLSSSYMLQFFRVRIAS